MLTLYITTRLPFLTVTFDLWPMPWFVVACWRVSQALTSLFFLPLFFSSIFIFSLRPTRGDSLTAQCPLSKAHFLVLFLGGLDGPWRPERHPCEAEPHSHSHKAQQEVLSGIIWAPNTSVCSLTEVHKKHKYMFTDFTVWKNYKPNPCFCKYLFQYFAW